MDSGQGSAFARSAQMMPSTGVPPTPRDTVSSRLDHIINTTVDMLKMVDELAGRVGVPVSAQLAEKEPAAVGIHGQALTASNLAMRLRDRLNDVINTLV